MVTQDGGIGGLSLKYNNIRNCAAVTDDPNMVVTSNGKLVNILGFKQGVVILTPDERHYPKQYAPHSANIHVGCYKLFIYTDIVDCQISSLLQAALHASVQISNWRY